MFRYVLTFILFMSLFWACRPSAPNFSHRLKLENWSLQSADSVQTSWEQITSADFDTQNWLTVHVPTTVLGALIKAGKYKDVFVGTNLRKIPVKPFKNAWWYRCRFDLPNLSNLPVALLRFNGINYRADVFLNGKKIASKDSLFGAFRVFDLNISSIAKERNNVLAVCVYPPRPGDFSIGFVDWNPAPPDKNMGLWRPVEIHRAQSVLLTNPFVKTEFDSAMKIARLTVRVTAENLANRPVNGFVRGQIESRRFRKAFHLEPQQKAVITITPEYAPNLIVKQPRLWWPVSFGQPHLYVLKLSATVGGKLSDAVQTRFGMRKVESYFTSEGHRGFKINGHKILIRGAGWTDDLFLASSPQYVRDQLHYVKQMGLNTVRLEGFWGNDQTLYDTCDSLGILLMAGFSCHWEWEDYLGKTCDRFGGAKTQEEMHLLADYWRDQITMLRNHPSIFVWLGGSDMLPRPALEKRYLTILKQLDGTRPYLGAAASLVSKVSGPTGVKMNGPYDYVPPKYWFEDTTHGGAYGFNTETGPGPQPPPLSSLRRMLTPKHLWPMDSVWNFHCGRHTFNSLARYNEALNKRYGSAKDVDDFVRKAQAMNYEAMRAMFEAFAVHKFHSTGVIQWMLNSAWPELYWQLYDYYLMPNGAFYGAKKACDSLQLMYDYANDSVYLHNATLKAFQNLRADIHVLDSHSSIIRKKSIQTDISANGVKALIPVQSKTMNSKIYFLDLRLQDASGREIATNFYWLSQKPDVLDYVHSTWFITPLKQFADFQALQQLPMARVSVKTVRSADGRSLTVYLHNTSQYLAFMLYLELQNAQGQPVLPVFWSDNYLSLLPGEKRAIHVRFKSNEKTHLKIDGWNTIIQLEHGFALEQ